MPPKKPEGVLFTVHQWATLIVAFSVIVGGVFTIYDAKANKADVEAAIAEVRVEMAEISKTAKMQRLEDYNDQIHILDSKPSKDAHDRSTIRYLENRKKELILEIENGG